MAAQTNLTGGHGSPAKLLHFLGSWPVPWGPSTCPDLTAPTSWLALQAFCTEVHVHWLPSTLQSSPPTCCPVEGGGLASTPRRPCPEGFLTQAVHNRPADLKCEVQVKQRRVLATLARAPPWRCPFSLRQHVLKHLLPRSSSHRRTYKPGGTLYVCTWLLLDCDVPGASAEQSADSSWRARPTLHCLISLLTRVSLGPWAAQAPERPLQVSSHAPPRATR